MSTTWQPNVYSTDGRFLGLQRWEGQGQGLWGVEVRSGWAARGQTHLKTGSVDGASAAEKVLISAKQF